MLGSYPCIACRILTLSIVQKSTGKQYWKEMDEKVGEEVDAESTV